MCHGLYIFMMQCVGCGHCFQWILESLGQKKILNCFSGHFFEKQMQQGVGGVFLFLFNKKQMREPFFQNLNDIFFKSCALTVISSDIIQSNKVAKIRNRYNQVPHLTQDTNGKVTNSKTPQTRAKRSALSQQVTTKHI